MPGGHVQSLGLVLPVYNAQSVLEKLVREMAETLPAFIQRVQAVLVDLGSSDATSEVAYELALEYPQVQFTTHRLGAGYPALWRHGAQRTDAHALVLGNEGWVPEVQALVKLHQWLAQADVIRAVPAEPQRADLPAAAEGWPVLTLRRPLAEELFLAARDWRDWLDELRYRGCRVLEMDVRPRWLGRPLAARPQPAAAAGDLRRDSAAPVRPVLHRRQRQTVR